MLKVLAHRARAKAERRSRILDGVVLGKGCQYAPLGGRQRGQGEVCSMDVGLFGANLYHCRLDDAPLQHRCKTVVWQLFIDIHYQPYPYHKSSRIADLTIPSSC
jgi:hypothetical protein